MIKTNKYNAMCMILWEQNVCLTQSRKLDKWLYSLYRDTLEAKYIYYKSMTGSVIKQEMLCLSFEYTKSLVNYN